MYSMTLSRPLTTKLYNKGKHWDSDFRRSVPGCRTCEVVVELKLPEAVCHQGGRTVAYEAAHAWSGNTVTLGHLRHAGGLDWPSNLCVIAKSA